MSSSKVVAIVLIVLSAVIELATMFWVLFRFINDLSASLSYYMMGLFLFLAFKFSLSCPAVSANFPQWTTATQSEQVAVDNGNNGTPTAANSNNITVTTTTERVIQVRVVVPVQQKLTWMYISLGLSITSLIGFVVLIFIPYADDNFKFTLKYVIGIYVAVSLLLVPQILILRKKAPDPDNPLPHTGNRNGAQTDNKSTSPSIDSTRQ